MTEYETDETIELECGCTMKIGVTVDISGQCCTGGGGGGGGISFVGSTGATSVSTDTPPVVDLTSLAGGSASAPSEGDLVIYLLGLVSGTDLSGTLTVGSGYTVADENWVDQPSFRDNFTIVAYKFMGATPDTSISVAGIPTGLSARGLSASVLVVRGVDVTTPLDGVAVGFVEKLDRNTVDPGAITPATDGAMVVLAGASVESGSNVVFDAPSDLDYFVSYASGDANIVARSGIGYKVIDPAAEFDGERWEPGGYNTGRSSAVYSFCLRPA